MKKLLKNPFTISPNFCLKAIAEVNELINYDMIYIYHQLCLGDEVDLKSVGTNLKGDICYTVSFKGFTIGTVILGGHFRSYYESNPMLSAKIITIQKEKFLPVRKLDIEVNLIQLKNVS